MTTKDQAPGAACESCSGTVLILVAAALLVGYRMWGAATMPEVEVARAIG